MNFQNLEYFLAAAEEPSLTRAAERLHISQQALSNQIARLEEELGCRLFARKPSFELTYSGKCFQKAAVKLLDIQHQTEALLGDINENRRGELRIGISHTRGQAILPLLLPDFHRAYPLAELSVLEGSSKELEADLDRGVIDVMIGFAPFLLESAETLELSREHLYLVASKALLRQHFGDKAEAVRAAYRENHDVTVFKDLPFVLLKKDDRIRALVDAEFRRRSVDPEVCFETRNIQTAYALAAEGMGLTVLPTTYLTSRYTISCRADSYTRQRVDVFPFFDRISTDVIAIGYNRERYLSELAKDFIRMSVEKFHALRGQSVL